MDPNLAAELAPQMYQFDKKIGGLLVREVPHVWKAIDLHVFIEWPSRYPMIEIDLESPEDHPTDDVTLSHALQNLVGDYVWMFKKYNFELSGFYVAMRQKPDGNWKYKINYEYAEDRRDYLIS